MSEVRCQTYDVDHIVLKKLNKKLIKKNIHILLIGPVTNVEANLIGGATISFGYLIDYLEKNSSAYTLVTTQYFSNKSKGILNPLYVLGKVAVSVFKADVLFLNSSRNGIKYLAPLLFIIAKIFRLKFVVRPFGGDLNEYAEKFNSISKWFFKRTTLQADLLFLQTKKLMDFYATANKNIHQLPTSRDTPNITIEPSPYRRRFIFLGFINKSKGIDHLLEAARDLGSTYTIHIYGPIRENYEDTPEKGYTQKFEEQPGIYQGVLSKDQVLSTVQTYDVLVLPTYYRGEGYPGVIMEAYSLGLPVITTKWKAIPEIVMDGKTGLLIEPKSTSALLQAMQVFNENNYLTFSKNAKEYFDTSFSTQKVTSKAIMQIQSLFN